MKFPMKAAAFGFLFGSAVFAATVVPAIKEPNPHTGTAIDTAWDHKGGIAEGVFRVLPPAKILKELENMQHLNICKGNMSRCEQPLFIPMCVDGDLCKKDDPKGWQIFEYARWKREAVQDGPQHLVLTLSPTFNVVNQLTKDFTEKYAPIYYFNRFDYTMNFGTHPSNVNYVTVGDVLKISGGGRIELTGNEYVVPKQGHIVGKDFTTVKNGVTYLNYTGPDGKKYGVRLEALE